MKFCFFLCCTILIGSCGYTLSHRLKSSFQSDVGIFIPMFDNDTDEMGAERVFTNALMRELSSRGERVLASNEPGSHELRGKILSISYLPTTFTEPGVGGLGLRDDRRIPSQLAVSATIELQLLDPKTKKVIWKRDFSGYRRVDAPIDRTYNYQAPSHLGPLTQSIVENQYQEVARQIMYDVYDQMTMLP